MKADGHTAARESLNRQPTLVAIDLGAESCRVSLLRWPEGAPNVQLVHRFPNGATDHDNGDGLRWNIRRICDGVEEGLMRCAELAPEGIRAIGVDGWAVDYVRIDADGEPIANPFCYRDARNTESLKQVHARIGSERLYTLTGIQILPLNTLYQLFADRAEDQSAPWVNLPEFLLTHLGGKRVAEYTNATQTQLLEPDHLTWCREIFEATGLDITAAPPLAKSGTSLGEVRGRLAALPAFRKTTLIAPACHDTASAIAGIPTQGDDWAFISSGTWSLVGSVLDAPCISEAARSKNFSNEGGVGGKTYFLKNVNGMWLLRQCMEHWQAAGQSWTVERLIEMCAPLPAPVHLFDVDDPRLVLPGNMAGRINTQLLESGRPAVPETPEMAPDVANLIFHSLAARYAEVLRDLVNVTGKTLRRLYIVGGGSGNSLLNRLTARATGLEVVAGASESATLGNFAVQLAALSGDYAPNIGVAAAAVARGAESLTHGQTQATPRLVQSVLTS